MAHLIPVVPQPIDVAGHVLAGGSAAPRCLRHRQSKGLLTSDRLRHCGWCRHDPCWNGARVTAEAFTSLYRR
jgi:hypothetical protein